MSEKIIYSANEAALTGKGFWSTEEGTWVSDIEDATRFDMLACRSMVYPSSIGQDADLVSPQDMAVPQGDKIIYSANEAATNDAGFWSNDDGWVGDLEAATRFTAAEAETVDLPMSLGSDAVIADVDQFIGVSDPDWDAIP